MLKLGTYGRDVLNLKFRLDEIIKTNTFLTRDGCRRKCVFLFIRISVVLSKILLRRQIGVLSFFKGMGANIYDTKVCFHRLFFIFV